MFTRLVVISDKHSGHVVGLTPPEFQFKPRRGNSRWNKWALAQKEIWSWYSRTIRSLSPIDHLLVNGDSIDGDGWRSGGTEVVTTDRQEQARIALICIELAEAKKVTMTYGTAYHTGNQEDFEESIAKGLGCKIGSHEWLRIAGRTIDCKHHLGNTTVPYGVHTALAKEVIQNHLWATRGQQPPADILIRSHVHKYACCESKIGNKIVKAISTPALQGYGSKFGARRCSGTVDLGLVVIDFHKKHVEVHPIIPELKCLEVTG
jgi:hypothetical protein